MDNFSDRAISGVIIDPGNGGEDIGAVGNGINEKDFNLDISKYMYDRFKELGVPVTLTRNADVDLDANSRVSKATNTYGDNKDVIVISNHLNTGGKEGAEVVYALRNSDALSNKVLNYLAQEGALVSKNYQRRLPTNPSQDYYSILRETSKTEPILIEYGYVDNVEDANRLKNDYKKYAEGVVRAVMEYKGLKYAPVKGSSDYYTVESGDTLWTISRKFGLSVDELKELNNLSSNTLSIGQTLKVSSTNNGSSEGTQTGVETGSDSYVVKSGDTLWTISKKFNTSVNEIKELNGLSSDNLSIGQVLKIPQATGTTNTTKYTVVSGDSLWKIASKFGTTVDAIKDLNGLTSNVLSIGQVLNIPANSKYNVYTVASGDTLYFIAMRNNTTVDKIKALNNLTSNNLSIGQKLLIPTS